MLIRAYASILVLALAPLAAFGCATESQSRDDEETAEIQSALELDDGGMSTDAEQPSFGDAAVAAAPEMVADFADATDLVAPIIAVPGAQKYHLMMVWGHLPPAHDQDETLVTPSPVNWTGRIAVDQGAIGVDRTLKFDMKDGVAPRTAPNYVEFTSRTLPHVDGLLVTIAIPAGGSKTIHFETAALTTDIDLSQIPAKAGGMVPVGDGRNGLAFIGFQDEPGMAKGFVLGKWGKHAPEVGRLRGRVVNAKGEELGRVKGIWGHAPKKDKELFFGKVIDAEGAFRGLFGGSYADGKFQGKWGVKGPASAGTVEGHYSDGADAADGRGAFVGRWSEADAAN